MSLRPLAILFGFGLLIVVAIMLESWRQSRRYGRGSGRGSSLARAGILEAQALLEPDRKVEIFKVEEKRDLEAELRLAGDPPGPPARGSRRGD